MSLTVIVSSVSSSGVSAIRPDADTARRGEAASSRTVIRSLSMLRLPTIWTDAFVGDKEIADRRTHVISRRVEGPAAAGREVDEPGDRARRLLRRPQRFGRDRARIEVERVGAVPADERGPGSTTLPFDDLNVLETGALALEADAGGGRLERLAVRHAVGDLHRAEAVGREVLAVDVELAAERAVDVVLVHREGMPQVGNRPTTISIRALISSPPSLRGYPIEKRPVVLIRESPDVMTTSETST